LLLPAHLVTKVDVDSDKDPDNVPERNQPHSMNTEQFDSNDVANCEGVVANDETLSTVEQPRILMHNKQSKSPDSKHSSTISSLVHSTHSASKSSSRKLFADNPHNLDVGNMIQFGNPPCYGIIKWIGSLPNYERIMAGVEMVCCLIEYLK